MDKLSDKEIALLDFLLNETYIQVYRIKQEEMDQGLLDYSLCSDDKEKQKITTKKVNKFRKKVSKSNPVVAGYLYELIRPNPYNTEYSDLVDILTKNFLLTEYNELFDDLLECDLSELEKYSIYSIIESYGYGTELLKDFVQGICDVNSYLFYKSFIDIFNNQQLNNEKVIQKLNDAFFTLEAFMNGAINDYKSFDFDSAFTELFYITRKPENYTYENCKRINFYWDLLEQIRIDFDKSNFANVDAYENSDFCSDCNSIIGIGLYRVEEFIAIQPPDEIERQERKKSISDIMTPLNVGQKTIKAEPQKTVSRVSGNQNPYPRIFKSFEAYTTFDNLYNKFENSNQNLANYSFLFHRMKKDNLIYDNIKHIEFIDFLSLFDIHIDRIKPLTQLGNNLLRESTYNSNKSTLK
jgi:hypothetical protein